MTTAKDTALALIDKLPDEASWDDILYKLYVKQKIEAGLEAVAEGRTTTHEEIKKRLMQRKRLVS